MSSSARVPLAEQVIVVTGASSGIGRCAAQHLAARGARVVLTARRAGALDALAREIRAAGGEAIALAADVTEADEVRAVAREAVRRFGRIDTWINNAAVYIQGRVQDLDVAEYRRLLDVNLTGYIIGTKCALEEAMLEQGRGGIIQVSSVLGRRGAAYFSAYAAAKAGVDGFSQSVRAELWGTGIRISTLYLPPVDTPIYRHARGKFGTVPKPPPPVADPAAVARTIATLAERPQNERVTHAFGHLYLALGSLPSRFGDWFLHHTGEFTRSDIPDQGDNLERPADDRPRVRDGWAEPGWKGLTVQEVARVLPWESLLGAAALGFAVGRSLRRPDSRPVRRLRPRR